MPWTGGLIPGRKKKERFLFLTASRPALRHTQWILGSLSPRVMQQRHEADYSYPSSDAWSYTSVPHTFHPFFSRAIQVITEVQCSLKISRRGKNKM
jgi:hypothetical protein